MDSKKRWLTIIPSLTMCTITLVLWTDHPAQRMQDGLLWITHFKLVRAKLLHLRIDGRIILDLVEETGTIERPSLLMTEAYTSKIYSL